MTLSRRVRSFVALHCFSVNSETPYPSIRSKSLEESLVTIIYVKAMHCTLNPKKICSILNVITAVFCVDEDYSENRVRVITTKGNLLAWALAMVRDSDLARAYIGSMGEISQYGMVPTIRLPTNPYSSHMCMYTQGVRERPHRIEIIHNNKG